MLETETRMVLRSGQLKTEQELRMGFSSMTLLEKEEREREGNGRDRKGRGERREGAGGRAWVLRNE